MLRRIFGFFGRGLAALWYGVDVLRRVVFNLLFLLVAVIVVAALWRAAPTVPEGAALVLRPSGALVEQRSIDDPLTLVLAGRTPTSQTPLRDLLEAVEAATKDARIKALVIETDDLQEAGLSKLAELRAAILAFKASGKPVYARGERMSQAQYYFANVADEIHLAPDGYLLLRGLARYTSYFKNALDKLGAKVHVFRVGEYKSFSEPFTRTDMSEEDRAATRDLLQGLWMALREDVEASRPAAAATLARYIEDYPGVLAATEGDPARAALDARLVDRLSTRDEWRDMLVERVGRSDDGKDYRGVKHAQYLAAVRAERSRAPDRVAVLVAQGAIVDGDATTGAVGGDTFARLVREAREDDQVKAVVLRIDSPGGSAWASEVIRRELELTREAGKPVIASMSSVAASGGYWIALGANEIWANPTSVTGSIGIFALFPEIAEPLERMGVTMDGVATAPLAGAFDPRRPLEPAAAATLQQGIEYGYRRFIELVSKARGMTVAEVELVAQGRVWTGEAASKLGLVDELGGLDAAIAAAAARAGIERFELVWPQAERSALQLLVHRLSDALAEAMPAAGTASPLGSALATLQAEAQALLRWNDPQHLYAHCLCAGP